MKKPFQYASFIFEYLATIFLASIMVIVVLQVIFRYVIQIVVPWTEEMSRYLCIWMVFMGATAAVAKKSHICVTFVVDRAPEKLRYFFNLFSLLVVWIFNLIVFLGSIELVRLNWGQQAVTFPVSIGVLYLSITLSSFSILVFLLIQIYLQFKAHPFRTDIER